MLAQEGEFLRNMYSFVYDLLGEETVVRWYSVYAEKCSGARMAGLSGDGRRFARADVAGLTG